MEEIKTLVNAVAGLPNLAVWVVLGFLLYKMSILASLYGTIRFVAQKTHGFGVAKKTAAPIVREIHDKMGEIYIHSPASLQSLLSHIAVRDSPNKSPNHIHTSDVDWLRSVVMKAIKEEQKS